MRLNIPTWLTLFRVILIPFFVLAFYFAVQLGTCCQRRYFVIAAMMTDWFDGFLACRLKQTTRFPGLSGSCR